MNRSPLQGMQLEQLHSDVAAFNEEMRKAQQAPAYSRYRAGLAQFGFGAFAALATFAVAALLLKI
jgi:hypothetical protein